MRKLITLALSVFLSLSALSQTAILMPSPRFKLLDQNGQPAAGGCLFFYSAGTSSPLSTYADSQATILNQNPVVMDSTGEAWIYLQSAVSYKVVAVLAGTVANCADGTQLWSADNVLLASSAGAPAGSTTQLQYNCSGAFCGGNGLTWNSVSQTLSTVGLNVSAGGSLSGTFTGSPTYSGAPSFSGSPFFNAGATMAGTYAGTPTFSPGLNTFRMSNIRFADNFTGTFCSDKITAADADLATLQGEIWVSQACGLNFGSVTTVSANHTLRFVQGGIYLLSNLITLGSKAAIVGPPSSSSTGVAGANDNQVILKQADTKNLPGLLSLGPLTTVDYITIDGNKANNTSTVCVGVVDSGRVSIRHTNIQNCPAHGINITSTGSSNFSCCGKLIDDFFYGNASDDVRCSGTADWNVNLTAMETAGQYGIELSDCGGWRIHDSDFGMSVLDGLYIHGSSAGQRANAAIITGNQFGSNTQNDIRIVGYDTVGGAFVSGSHVIVGNSFIGGGTTRTPDATYDALNLPDSNNNTITGNLIATDAVAHSNKCGIEITETAGGRAAGNNIVGNTFNGTFGTNELCDNTTNSSGSIVRQLVGKGTLTYGSIAANVCAEQSVTVTKAATDGAATASPVTNLGNVSLSFSARVSAANTVAVKVCNNTVGALTPNVVAWTVFVTQPYK